MLVFVDNCSCFMLLLFRFILYIRRKTDWYETRGRLKHGKGASGISLACHS